MQRPEVTAPLLPWRACGICGRDRQEARTAALGPIASSLLVQAVADARRAATEERVDDLVAFATSVVREADDGAQAPRCVLTGMELDVLTGEDQAAMMFFPVRRWSAGARDGCSASTSTVGRWRCLPARRAARGGPAGAARGADGVRARAVEVCPWAMRGGVVLRRLAWLVDQADS